MFDKFLLKSIDSALETLGPSFRKLTFLYLQRKYSISRGEIPRRLDDFIQGLHDLLGSGSGIIERMIVKGMTEKNRMPAHITEGKSIVDIVRLASPGMGP